MLFKKTILAFLLINTTLLLSCSIKNNNENDKKIATVEKDADNEKEEVVEIASSSTNTKVHCGVERWDIKTGTDTNSSKINLNKIVNSSLEELINIKAPNSDNLKDSPRISPTEETVFTINATLTQFRQEGDSDYHLVLVDNKNNTMIAEIPLSDCVGKGSPLANGIKNARKQFDAKYKVLPPYDQDGNPSPFQDANVPVKITGVGFFDFPHGQNGLAKNAIELHPVLNIEFTSKN